MGKLHHKKKEPGSKQLKKVRKDGGKNAKAFTYKSAIRAARATRRTADVQSKKLHLPSVDRSPLEPPPVCVAVVGPPKVGKSSLIAGLIKNFTRQSVSNITGPVTVVSGKKRRLTLIECGNDLNSMIDVAKVADLVLLLVDASFGFEMETFEFLNILQVHGFPKLMGVLTHLDLLHSPKAIRKTKKRLKQRFWTEIYQGAKLFYLSGMSHGQYPKAEIHNLGRFISVMKFAPLEWRSSHPYLLADRMEDLTPPELVRSNAKCDRRVSLYGYVRGSPLKPLARVHVPGCGDFVASGVSILPDPCPLPDQQKKRSLSDKERLVYAPLSGVGGLLYDKDAVYIELAGSHALEDEGATPTNAMVAMVTSMQGAELPLDSKMEHAAVSLLKDQGPILNDDDANAMDSSAVCSESGIESSSGEDNESSEDEDEMDSGSEAPDGAAARRERRAVPSERGSSVVASGRDFLDTEAMEGEEDSEDEEEEEEDVSSCDEDGWFLEEALDTQEEQRKKKNKRENKSQVVPSVSLQWKSDMEQNALASYEQRKASLKSTNLQALIYGNDNTSTWREDEGKGEGNSGRVVGHLFAVRDKTETSVYHMEDQSIHRHFLLPNNSGESATAMAALLENDNNTETLKRLFVTGDWGEEDAGGLLEGDEGEGEGEGDTGEQSGGEEGEGEDDEQKRLREKKELKKSFDADYDESGESNYFSDLKQLAAEQTQRNREELSGLDQTTRVSLEGIQAGCYVRLEMTEVPCEFVVNFDPSFPVVVGGLLPGEERVGLVRARLKRHRWYKRVLKTRDPLILSVGWRRFQTTPVYCMEEHNMRQRMVKYTPEHLHCMAVYYGPLGAPGVGVLGMQSVSDTATADFRIAATGTVLEVDYSSQIVKKLRLTGSPFKIFKNTAFIKGMFNSALECAKFQGATLRTVSGMRGQLKKALRSPEGGFRATFEDRILMSDIVFVCAWYPVAVPRFYNPVTSLLLSDKTSWTGMRTVGMIHHQTGTRPAVKKDSLYKPVARETRHFHSLHIPASLEKHLPFASRPKQMERKKGGKKGGKERGGVVLEPRERQVVAMLQQLGTIHREKTKKKRASQREKHKAFLKQKAQDEMKQNKKVKQLKRDFYRGVGANKTDTT